MNWESYITAVVRINFAEGDVELHPAPLTRTVGTFPNVEGRTVHIITAHNPGGRDASPAANEKAHRRLQAQVTDAGLTWWPAAGGNPTWTHVEASVAVIGLDDDAARALGAAYGQEAIFAWRPKAWLVLSCTDAGAGLTGWALQPTPVPKTAVPTTAPDPHLLPRAPLTAPDQP
jgi:hypothetical protein